VSEKKETNVFFFVISSIKLGPSEYFQKLDAFCGTT